MLLIENLLMPLINKVNQEFAQWELQPFLNIQIYM